MRLAVFACVLLTACGRVHFEPGCAPGELANGIDDDGDLAVDEGCSCTPFDSEFSGSRMHDGPGLVWTGTSYVSTLLDANTTRVGLIAANEDGAFSAPTWLDNTAVSPGRDTLAWNGTQGIMVSGDMNGAIVVDRFDADAAALGSRRPFSVSGFSPKVAWANGRFVIAYNETAGVVIGEVDDDGSLLRDATALSPPVTGVMSGIAVDGDTVVLLLRDQTLVRVRNGVAEVHPLDLVGTGYNSFARGVDAYAVVSHENQPLLEVRELDGSARSGQVVLPLMSTSSAPTYLDVAGTGDGYRLLAAVNNAGQQLSSLELDRDGNTGMLTPITTVHANGWSDVSSVSAYNRVGSAFTYLEGGYHHRLFQQCF